MEHNHIDNSTLPWITQINESFINSGILYAKDAYDEPIILTWELINASLPRLTEKIKSASSILVCTYTTGEIQFAQKHPEAVPNEFFLQSLAPFFINGTQAIDWNLMEEKISLIFQQFFAATDFSTFAKNNEIHLFIVAHDIKSELPLGVIQFIVLPEFAHGELKAAFYGVLPEAQNRGLEKLLMSSIFTLIPTVKRIFLHTRKTNVNALATYKSWGFTTFTGPLAYWIDMEYKIDQSDILQKTADSITTENFPE